MLLFICCILMVSTAAAFVLSLANKWHVIEWVQLHGSRFFAKMFNCRFCLSWWSGVVISVMFAIGTFDPVLLFVPIFSTPLTRLLL